MELVIHLQPADEVILQQIRTEADQQNMNLDEFLLHLIRTGLKMFQQPFESESESSEQHIKMRNLLDTLDDEVEADILADEAQWDALFTSTQDSFTTMAEQVRADIQAGNSLPMVFTTDGKLASE